MPLYKGLLKYEILLEHNVLHIRKHMIIQSACLFKDMLYNNILFN